MDRRLPAIDGAAPKVHLMIIVALVLAKPSDEPTPEYIKRLRKNFSIKDPEASVPSHSAANFLSDGAVQSTATSNAEAKLRSRVEELEKLLEAAQVERDHAVLGLIKANKPLSSSNPPAPLPNLKKGPKRKKDTLPEGPPKGKKPKGSNLKETEAATSQNKVSIQDLVENLKSDPEMPTLTSSLDILASMERYETFSHDHDFSSHESRPDLYVHAHISRSISSISRLLHIALRLQHPLNSLSILTFRTDASPVKDPRSVLRVASVLLGRIIQLESSTEPMNLSALSTKDILTKVVQDIVDPFIRSFCFLSSRAVELAFASTTVLTGNTANNASFRPVIDLRKEVLDVLVRILLDAPLPPPKHPQMPKYSSNSSLEVPLSGRTVVESQNASDGDIPRDVETPSIADVIIILCTSEILRVTAQYSSKAPLSTPHVPGDTPDKRSDTGIPQSSSSVFTSQAIVLEETLWYLCSLVHTCIRERFKCHLSNEALLRARDSLLATLQQDQELTARSTESRRSEDGLFSMVVRGMMYAVLEAVNGCCDVPWEGDEIEE